LNSFPYLRFLNKQDRKNLDRVGPATMPPRKKKAQKVEETPDEKTRRVVRQKVTELMNVPRAAYMGDAAALDALAQNLDGKELRGALNTPDDNGRTPCSIAAQNGKLDALKKMIELKADPSIPSYGGEFHCLDHI
jgi:hypothetical protein